MLAPIAHAYSELARVEIECNSFERHLLKYDDIALTNLIYASTQSQLYPVEVLFEELVYVFRFMLIEYCHSLRPVRLGDTSWAWSDISLAFEPRRAWTEDVRVLLRLGELHKCELTVQEVASWLLRYFEIRDELVMDLGMSR